MKPQNSFFDKLAEKLVESGIGLELFVAPSSYADIATIGFKYNYK